MTLDPASRGRKTKPDIAASKRVLEALTGLRALAAGWVVVTHFTRVLYSLFPSLGFLRHITEGGVLGVDIFFVLSGFIIAYNYADRLQPFTWMKYRDFLVLRVARIYPVHFITLLAVASVLVVAAILGRQIAWTADVTPLNVFGNLFLLQAIPGVQPINQPAWSISAEFGAYLAFPLLALLFPLFRNPLRGLGGAAISSLAASIALGAYVTFVESIPGSGFDNATTQGAGPWLRILLEFATGCLAYIGWRQLSPLITRRYSEIAAWTGLVGVVAIACAFGASPFLFAAVPFITLMILGLAGSTGLLARILGSRVLVWGGRVSYSVYMTHFFVVRLAGNVLPLDALQNSALPVRAIVLVALFLIVVAVGSLTYYLIEEPGRKLLRHLATRKPIVTD